MKRSFRSLVAMFTLALSMVIGSAFAQTGSLVLKMTTPDGKIVTTDKQKIAEFTIKGLSTQAQVDALVSKAMAYNSVIAFNISSAEVNGERTGKAVFGKSIDKGYFKTLLTHLGVTTVIINGKEMPVSELGSK